MAKYRLQRYEVSTDNGVTWTPVTPEQFRKGELLDNNIGCETVEWRIVEGEYVCDEAGNPTVTVLASGVINAGDCTSNVFNDIASLSYTSEKYIIGSDSGNEYHTSYESTSDYDPCEQYQWVDTGTTICYDGNRYKVEKQQHLVNGEWVDTGVQRHSALIGEDSSCNVSRWIERGQTTVIDGTEYFIQEEELSTDGGNSFKLTGNTQSTGVVANMLSGNAVTYAFRPIYDYDDDGMIVSYDNGDTWERYYLYPSVEPVTFLNYAVGTSTLGTWTRDDTITDLIDWNQSYSATLPRSSGSNEFAVNWHGTTYNSKQTIWSSLGCNDVDLTHNAGIIYYPVTASGKENPYIAFMNENGSSFDSYSYYFRGICLEGDYYYNPYTDIGRNAFGPKLVGNVVQCTSLDASSVALTWNEFIILWSKTNHYLGLNRYADGDGIFYVLYDFNDLKYTVFRTTLEEENPVETRWTATGNYVVEGTVIYNEEKEQLNYNETGWVDTGNVRKGEYVGEGQITDGVKVFRIYETDTPTNKNLQYLTYDASGTTKYLDMWLNETTSAVTENYDCWPMVIERTGEGLSTSDRVLYYYSSSKQLYARASYELLPDGTYTFTDYDGSSIGMTAGRHKLFLMVSPTYGGFQNTGNNYINVLFNKSDFDVKYISPMFYREYTYGANTWKTKLYGSYQVTPLNYICFKDWGYTSVTANMTSSDIQEMFYTGESYGYKYPLTIDLTGAHADFKAKVRAISGITSEIIDND